MTTLADLKASNAAAEGGEEVAEEVTEEITEEIEEETTEEETEESESTEAWMQTDDKESATDKMPVAAHVKMKHKLKGTIGEQKDEIAELRSTVERMKAGKDTTQAATQQELGPMPTLESCGGDESKLEKDMQTWVRGTMRSEATTMQQETATTESAQASQQALGTAIDNHYGRAAALAEATGITPEVYKAADVAVRTAVEQVMPGQGDLVTDQLIAQMGEGSEKVLYYLGRNTTEMAAVQKALQEDPGGIKAAILLGEMKAKIASPQKRQSRAPDPAKHLSGDQKPVTAGAKALKKNYDAAVKSNNPQGRIDAKRQAKREGVDTSGWS